MNLNLTEIRVKLARLENHIIFGLFERSEYRTNLLIYLTNGIQVPKQIYFPDGTKRELTGSFFEYMKVGTEALHASAGRYGDQEEIPFSADLPKSQAVRRRKERTIQDVGINKTLDIMKIYFDLLPKLCTRGEDNDEGSSVVCDIRCLQEISRRVHLGMQVAEAKFREDSEGYQRLMLARDEKGLREKLKVPKVEQQVLERVMQKGERYEVDPSVVMEFFRDKLIPLTLDVEVEYLMRRK